MQLEPQPRLSILVKATEQTCSSTIRSEWKVLSSFFSKIKCFKFGTQPSFSWSSMNIQRKSGARNLSENQIFAITFDRYSWSLPADKLPPSPQSPKKIEILFIFTFYHRLFCSNLHKVEKYLGIFRVETFCQNFSALNILRTTVRSVTQLAFFWMSFRVLRSFFI